MKLELSKFRSAGCVRATDALSSATTMATPLDSNVLADRRWLIGISISLCFGIFGAVMALLSYTDRNKAPDPRGGGAAAVTAAPAPPRGEAETKKGKGKRGRD